MQDFDEMKPIRDMLETYESSVPDFDTLFKGEVLGDTPLRQICGTKLNSFEAETPSFDQMFAGQVLGHITPKRRMVPIWVVIGAAAACFTLLLSLPGKIQMDQTPLSLMEQKHVYKAPLKGKAIVIDSLQKDIQTEKLESPKTIGLLAVDKKESETPETLLTYEESQMQRDSSVDNSLTKIRPSEKANLAVNYERSVEAAYAAAKIRKIKVKREKMNLGTSFNSANRLLSLVNTKSANAYPLQTAAGNYSAGYSSLEGASSSLLRAATISRNTWEETDNISKPVLDKYKAVYSLPINFGLSVSFPLFRRFEIITGLNYTYMSGTISGENETSVRSFNLKQELHYLGIPLKISMNIFKQGKFGAYAAFGGTIEKGIAGIQKSHVVNTDGEKIDWDSSQPVYGLQPSITGQLGLFYELNKTFNLYIEPGTSYFFPNDQPISSRTEEPFNFNIGIGLRYRIQ